MNKKRVAVVGRGTAGSQSILALRTMMPDAEFEWHYDPEIKTQAVGEGSTLDFSENLFTSLAFSHNDLPKIDGTFKCGIYKENFGTVNKSFFHDFAPPDVAYHFNAVALQNYVYDKIKDSVKIVEGNVTDSSQLDVDFVMDCSGKPTEDEIDENFVRSKYIAVNSVHVNQCFWDGPTFQHTKAIARPYGWVFCIPLKNRCSVGYMYNKNFNTLEEVQDDILVVINQLGLTPSTTTNTFTFSNYYRKQNFSDDRKVVYNGNASFFLEPMEATSISSILQVNTLANDVWNLGMKVENANSEYTHWLQRTERIIAMHYFAGSTFDTEYWKHAKVLGTICMQKAMREDSLFVKLLDKAKEMNHLGEVWKHAETNREYASWWLGAFYQNLNGLGITEELEKFRRVS